MALIMVWIISIWKTKLKGLVIPKITILFAILGTNSDFLR